jgi:hypothetical protein
MRTSEGPKPLLTYCKSKCRRESKTALYGKAPRKLTQNKEASSLRWVRKRGRKVPRQAQIFIDGVGRGGEKILAKQQKEKI